MTSNRTNGGKGVNVDLGLSAKASLEVKTEIPTQSSGRLLDALTDIIRPFSEARGLKADLIRLQREDVAYKITQKAKARLELEGHAPRPVPNKFLIPLLEKGSLEDDEVLIDRWADLLASAALDPSAAHPRFVQILSEMTGEDAKLLRRIALNHIDECEHPNQAFTDCCFAFDPRYFQRDAREWLGEHGNDVDAIYDHLTDVFCAPGVAPLDILVSSNDNWWSLKADPTDIIPLAETVNLEVLYSLNVVRQFSVEATNAQFEVEILYVCLTPLGVQFLKSCDRDLVAKLKI